MRKWRLYAWGANSHGQLGLGFQSEQSTFPCEVDLESSDLSIVDVKKIIGGAGHTMILDTKGCVYSCGLNDRGQTGTGHDNDGATSNQRPIVRTFERIKFPGNKEIKDIACGWKSSIALTEKGEIYTWGSNSHGQLGLNCSSSVDYAEPLLVDGIDERIKAVSMGLRHTAIVTETGRVMITGNGNKGQLGIVDEDNQSIRGSRTFRQITGLKNVAKVACGQNHTVVLTKFGQIYTWGDNKYGQLGIENNERTMRSDCPIEVKIGKISEFSTLHVGWTHTCIFRHDDERIVAWGRNTYGQLGYHDEDEKKCTWRPKMILGDTKFVQLSTGSEHNVAIAEDGSIYSWGWNEHGNCGDGDTRNVLEPKRVNINENGGQAYLVGTGAGHSFAIIVDET